MPKPPVTNPTPPPLPGSIDVPQELERFRQRLLDLSNRNALLNFKMPTKRSRSGVAFDGLDADAVWARLVESGKSVRIAADPPRETAEAAADEASTQEEDEVVGWRVVSSVRVGQTLALPPAVNEEGVAWLDEALAPEDEDDSPTPALPRGKKRGLRAVEHASEPSVVRSAIRSDVRSDVRSDFRSEEAASVFKAAAPPPAPEPDPKPPRERVPPPADALLAPMDDDRLDTVLRTIRSRARSSVEETGVNLLYLAAGMLEWYEDDKAEHPLLAPLVLIPVEIERSFDLRAGRYAYSLRYSDDEVPEVNLSLQKRLERDFGVVLPERAEESKPSQYFDEVRRTVEPRPRWRVSSRAVLGFFSFNRLLMYLDLDPARWPGDRPLTGLPLVRQVFEGSQRVEEEGRRGGLFSRDYDIDAEPEAAGVQLVVNADASQHSALVDVAKGRDLVIEGPPGTGKSQTITNAIADAMHDGRSVLFVAEKLAALEVVRANLERAGLGDLCLELHSDAASPKSVIESLSRRLSQEPPQPPRTEHQREALDEARDRLNAYADAIARVVGPRQETLCSVMWRVAELEGRGLAVPRGLERIGGADDATIRRSRALLDELAAVCDELGPPHQQTWHGFRPVARDDRDVADAKAAITQWRDASQALQEHEATAAERLGLAGGGESGNAPSIAASALPGSKDPVGFDLVERASPPPSAAAQSPSPPRHTVGETPFPPVAEAPANGQRPALRRLRESDVERWVPLASSENLPPAPWLGHVATAARFASARGWIALHDRYTRAAAIAAASVFGPFVDAAPAARDLDARLPRLDPVLGGLTRGDLPGLAVQLKALRGLVDRLLSTATKLEAAGLGPVRDLAEYDHAARLHKLLNHPAMADAAMLDPRLYQRITLQHLLRGRTRGEELLAQQAELATTFVLRDAPTPDHLATIRQVLRRHGRSMLRMLRGPYRLARGDVKAFLQPAATYEPLTLAAELERLEKHLADRAAFAADEPLNRLFPEMFRGMETDWKPLEQGVAWAQQTQKLGIDHPRAVELLGLREAVSQPMTPSQVREAAEAVWREWSGIQPPRLLGPPPAGGTPLAEVAERVAARVREVEGIVEASHAFRSDAAARVADLAAPAQAVLEAEATAEAVRGDRAYVEVPGDTGAIATAEAARPLADAVVWVQALLDAGLPEEVLFREDAGEQEHVDASHWITAQLKTAAAQAHRLRESHAHWLAGRAAAESLLTAEAGRLPSAEAGDAAAVDTSIASSLLLELAGLLPWVRYRQVVDRVTDAGLGDWAAAVDAGELLANQAADTFELAAYDATAHAAVAASPLIRDFTRAGHEGVRQRFADLDDDMLEMQQAQTLAVASSVEPPAGNATGRVGTYTEMGLIRHEAAKQTRFCKVRDLMSRAPASIAMLKPCLMMSPLSVAQFLPRDAPPFDLVVMDEASQIQPEDALGAIARARQLVVVGDPKQLPPTTFFERNFDDPDEPEPEKATAAYGSESILEVQMRTSPAVRRLKGHYRSKHESLIAFSNQYFYEGELVIFPSPTREAQGDSRLGVYHHRVDGGRFYKGRNPAEADALARAIIKHALAHPGESLGVGVFNLAQRELIEEILEAYTNADADARAAVERLSQADDRQEPLFIKNLENLQGDERDVIFLGYTYGPDPGTGRVMQRFGPITGQDGWRRLNVLITRAKRRVEVFASLSSTDIQGGPDKSRGVNAMRDYLAFAETGRAPGATTADEHAALTPFERTLTRIVEAEGLEAVPRVGVAGYFVDMGIRQPSVPDTYLLGIEHDGENYRAARSARDRDRGRAGVMHARGWTLHRIWSADWFQNPHAEEQRLRIALKAAVAAAASTTSPPVAIANSLPA